MFVMRFWKHLEPELHMEHAPDQDSEEMLLIIKRAMTRQSEALFAGLTEIAERNLTQEDLVALQMPFSDVFKSPEVYQSRVSAVKKLPAFGNDAVIFVREWAHLVGRDAFSHDKAFFLQPSRPDYRDPVSHGVTK